MSADVMIVDGMATVEVSGDDAQDTARKLLSAAGDDTAQITTVTLPSGTGFRCPEALARKAGLVATPRPVSTRKQTRAASGDPQTANG